MNFVLILICVSFDQSSKMYTLLISNDESAGVQNLADLCELEA